MNRLILGVIVCLGQTFSYAQEVCTTPKEVINCEGAYTSGFRTIYRQGFVEPGKTTDLLAYEYSGAEYFTGLYGLQCGVGPSELTAIIYGKQAEEFYASLNLPERFQNEYPYDLYKRINVDGTTEDLYKSAIVGCNKHKSSLTEEYEITCYIGINHVPERYPCRDDDRVYEFEGTITGLRADRLKRAINTNYLLFQYSNGQHIIDCDSSLGKGCTLRVMLNRSQMD